MKPKFLLPTDDDNVAIATTRIERGERLVINGVETPSPQVVPAGHRICVHPVATGESLLSWGLPFGTALRDIAPGDYICNQKVRDVLLMRDPDEYDETLTVNFEDRDTIAERILPSAPHYGTNSVAPPDGLTFQGYFRGRNRGWGTRNYLAVIAATSRSRDLVVEACETLRRRYPATANFDGVVPVIHTEGGGESTPHNFNLLVRTLAGFATNPNLAAAVIVNDEGAAVTNADVLDELRRSPISPVEYTLRYYLAGHTSDDGTDDPGGDDVSRICALVDSLMPQATARERQTAPLSGIRLGLQCGGSDAFSGVTANQVLGHAVHKFVQHGAIANLAETDELIGAEQYVLDKVASDETYHAFLDKQQRFKDYALAHGHSAEGNVSGGNVYRGLYNITLKSLGAARKKHPDTYLDHVIDYGTPMVEPGYYFMDSPGNDLESIAGQVASGANLILFTTGNGSITNHPFVPTIKIVTTNERYRLLESDMDSNAGEVLNGQSIADAGEDLFALTHRTAGGEKTRGEGSGQYQTQIWRDWHRAPAPGTGTTPTEETAPSGRPLRGLGHGSAVPVAATNRVLLPTSLCSGQVAEQVAQHLNTGTSADERDRVVALPHTEGCGVSGGNSEDIFRDTLIGYATHPLVSTCVFVEHGCEKTHNDYFRAALRERRVDPERFHWASIQHEGGIAAVSRNIESALAAPRSAPAASDIPAVGIASAPSPGGAAAARIGVLAARLLDAGVSVVIAGTDPALTDDGFTDALGLTEWAPTLRYSQRITTPGLHVMDTSSTDWLENATGLGACGSGCLVTTPLGRPWQPHRFIPTVQLGHDHEQRTMDLILDGSGGAAGAVVESAVDLVLRTLRGDYVPRTAPRPNIGFQISRGRYGVSL